MNLCKYVNVFQGNGQIDLPKPQGIAATWFFIKAQAGNTSPAATLPFGPMSVGPFSGGYPTGYGWLKPNYCANPPQFDDGRKLLGFAHLNQSGTGAIGYYYNYALVTPKYKTSEEYRDYRDEKASPGYYSTVLEDIKCELTTEKKCAYHKYTFGKNGGTVEVDFSNNGIRIPETETKKVYDLIISSDGDTVNASAKIEGITVYFSVKSDMDYQIKDNKVIYTVPNSKEALLKLAISPRSAENAKSYIQSDKTFDEVRSDAQNQWNKVLSRVRIETKDERIKEIFYSNMYHSLVKPADWSGDSFIYDNEEFVIDWSTFWDMYKTEFPFLAMICPDIVEKTVRTIMNMCDTFGLVPNNFGITDAYLEHSTQARMLGDYVMMTAYRYGLNIDADKMLETIKKDVFAEDKKDFTVDKKTKSYTFMLDMADGCRLAAEIAEENERKDIAEKLLPFAELWKKCYSEKTGLLKEDSVYYEGTLYNYSFRQMVDMQARIELAGGKENFVRLMDNFFGYGQPALEQPVDPADKEYIQQKMALGRFEGFNNETDMEAPYSYIYADRHDRTCEVMRAGMKYMFTTGRGGIPGNNDTGALSSYYVLSALGLFPVAGQDLFLIGSPFVDSAELDIVNNRRLEIKVNNNSENNIYVESVSFNGQTISDYRIKASKLLEGGELEFTMTDKNPIKRNECAE